MRYWGEFAEACETSTPVVQSPRFLSVKLVEEVVVSDSYSLHIDGQKGLGWSSTRPH